MPFDYAEELTVGLDTGTASVCDFLRQHGLHGRPLWRRQCACDASQPWGSLTPPQHAAEEAEVLLGLPAHAPQPAQAPASLQARTGPDHSALTAGALMAAVTCNGASALAFSWNTIAALSCPAQGAGHIEVLQSWDDFYTLCGLPRSSPAGVLTSLRLSSMSQVVFDSSCHAHAMTPWPLYCCSFAAGGAADAVQQPHMGGARPQAHATARRPSLG